MPKETALQKPPEWGVRYDPSIRPFTLGLCERCLHDLTDLSKTLVGYTHVSLKTMSRPDGGSYGMFIVECPNPGCKKRYCYHAEPPTPTLAETEGISHCYEIENLPCMRKPDLFFSLLSTIEKYLHGQAEITGTKGVFRGKLNFVDVFEGEVCLGFEWCARRELNSSRWVRSTVRNYEFRLDLCAVSEENFSTGKNENRGELYFHSLITGMFATLYPPKDPFRLDGRKVKSL